MIFDCHLHLTDPVDLILKEMDTFQVDRGIVCPSGIARGETVDSLTTARELMDSISRSRDAGTGVKSVDVSGWNRLTAEKVATGGGRLWGFAKVDLRLPEAEISEIMEEGLELGLLGFGEILGVETWSERFDYVVSHSAELGGYPVFVHADYPVTGEGIDMIAAVTERNPATPVILGHLGGDFWIRAVEKASLTANLYLDISEAVNLVAVRTAVSEIPGKVLYGSDFPWETMGVGIQRIKRLGLLSEVERGIFSGNLAGILDKVTGIPSIGPVGPGGVGS